MNDPRRLIDDPEVPDPIREALAGERRAKGALDLEHGWSKLRAAAVGAGNVAAISELDPDAGLADEATKRTTPPIGTSRWLRLGIGLTAIVAVAVTWTEFRIGGDDDASLVARGEAPAPGTPTSGTPVPGTSPPSTPQIAAPPVAPAARPVESASAAPTMPVTALPAASPARATRPSAKAPIDDNALREELAQLREIRARLDRDPASALRLCEDGQRRFSNGHLVEEREGLAVIALARVGRRDEARAKAAAFVNRYPKSTLVDRIAAELEAPR